MTHFQYSAITLQGKLKKGIINADHPKQARQLLRQKNLLPIMITSCPDTWSAFWHPWKIYSTHKLSKKRLSLISRQLATLVKANLPITDILTTVSEQTNHLKTKITLLSIKNKVMEGHSLASALSEYHETFSPFYCGIVATGEQSGHLAQVLARLADYTEQQFKIKQKIMYAMIYPVSLSVISLVIIIFLLTDIVPRMIAVYAQLHQTLPLLTTILVRLSAMIKNLGIYVILISFILSWGCHYMLKKNPSLRKSYHYFLLHIPLLGKSLQIINTARYVRTLAMLCSSRLPITESMTTASTLITNLSIRDAVTIATEQVREGTSIYLALKKTTFFSPFSLHLIASGEASGELETLLEHAAQQQEEEIMQFINSLLTLFEPALIIIMGGVVLFIVIAVLLPIFDINQLNQ